MSEHAAIQASVKTTPAPQPVAVEALPQPEPVQQDLYMDGLYRLPLQRKLSMGAADDPSEREADSMADKVMRMPAMPFATRTGGMPTLSSATQGESLQRKVEGPEEDELRIASDWADRENRAPRMPLPYGEEQDDQQIRRKPLASFIQRKAAENVITPVNAAVASGIESGKGTGSPLPAPARSCAART